MTRTAHAIDYSSPNLRIDGTSACRREIASFVAGIRGPRKTPVSERQIVAWMRATPADFVRDQISAACVAGEIRIVRSSLSSGRRHSGAYRYEIAK